MNLFPAVFIGGPPQVGKSSLAYSLSHELRLRRTQHYVLRVCPAEEGDPVGEMVVGPVRTIRLENYEDPIWLEQVRRDIARRHLPLLVDVDGRLPAFQEMALEECSHTILLTGEKESWGLWHERLESHHTSLLADLDSRPAGESLITQNGCVLHGTIAGLRYGAVVGGPTFRILTRRLFDLFFYSRVELYVTHLTQAPVETVIELERVARSLGIEEPEVEWKAQYLSRVLEYLPRHTPLGLYDSAPNWLHAALAIHAYPAPLYQFDVCLGWVRPPLIYQGKPSVSPLRTAVEERFDHIRLYFSLGQEGLDYSKSDGLSVPQVSFYRGIVLSGDLPLWLWSGLALAYRPALWLAIQPPNQQDWAVVVKSSDKGHPVGSLVHLHSPALN